MHANRQRAQLRAFENLIQLFMRQFEILTSRHLEFNQADVVVTGDNTRAGAGCQHALNARRTLVRGVAAAQL